MAEIEAKLEQMGLVLPEPLKVPAGITVPFSMVIVSGNRAYISGHPPQNPGRLDRGTARQGRRRGFRRTRY